MDLSSEEFKRGFLAEASSILEQFEQLLLKLERDTSSPQSTLDELFRYAHNLKGSAQLVGYTDYSKLAHRVEDALFVLKQGAVPLSSAAVNVLLKCLDRFSKMRTELNSNLDASFNNDDLLAELETLKEGKLVAAAPSTSVSELPAESSFEKAVSEPGVEAPAPTRTSKPTPADFANGIPADIEALFPSAPDESVTLGTPVIASSVPSADDPLFADTPANKVEPVFTAAPAAPAAADAPAPTTPQHTYSAPIPAAPLAQAAASTPTMSAPAPAGTNPTGSNSASQTKEIEYLRVAMPKVEALNNLVGELVILHTVLEQQRFTTTQDGLDTKAINQLGKLSKEIQDISMSFRMMPLKPTFQKMARIVRDTSQILGKRVKLVLRGEETEIDKTLADGLYDPLVHLIRNAIDHGLETPSERVHRGKGEEGIVTLQAYHEGNKICIQIDDDGHGIDPARVLAKAREKRLVRDESKLTPHDIIQMIFLPGFSTKEVVTDVSGRGVGMDVVKTNIEGMGGEVQVFTEMGKGTTFKILLPLTTAIIDAMVVQSGASKFVIPLVQVHESLKPKAEQIHKVTGVGHCLHLRGEVILLCDIAESLGQKPQNQKIDDRIAIIVRSAKKVFAVLVDDILKQQQVVIRKLGKELRYQKGIIGTSILGDGRPSFILDLVEMYAANSK